MNEKQAYKTISKKARPCSSLRFFHLVLLLAAFLSAPLACADKAAAKSNPKYASIVMDADTGLILYQRHADKILHPASIAKVMTLILAFDAIESGKLQMRDRLIVSRHAASMVPSKLGLEPGSTIRVEDAIYALVTKSANDVAVVLAEEIGGTESGFALMMTQKARAIGMNNTRFRNASGLHDPNQISTARDIAKMSQYLINVYPQYYSYFSTRKFTYRGTTYSNHNRLMDRYEGMDGLKTGYVQASGFNLAASAVRNNHRLIGVVMGGRTSRSRDAHMAGLLNSGFEKLDTIMVASRSVPVPPRKPAQEIVLASWDEIAPAAGGETDDTEQDSAEGNTKWAALNPVLQDNAFSKIIGEGDYDPAVSKRIETGLIAIASLRNNHGNADNNNKPQLIQAAYTPAEKPPAIKNRGWSVQVGAFSSRTQTDRALQIALAKLPAELSDAATIIVPLKTADGWLFRARLSGYEKAEAEQACRLIKTCLLVSPQAR